MKQFFSLLTVVVLISISAQMSAQTITPSGDVEVLINTLTTRHDLDKYAADLKSVGIKLTIVEATYNSANGVRSITFEVKWNETTAPDIYHTDDVRAAGDIWIIKTATTQCVGDCK